MAMSPLYDALSQSLSGQNDDVWDTTIKAHWEILARVSKRLTQTPVAALVCLHKRICHPISWWVSSMSVKASRCSASLCERVLLPKFLPICRHLLGKMLRNRRDDLYHDRPSP